MTSIGFLKFLILFLVHWVYSEEAEPVFREKGSTIEMGYCFGVDYIAVYRCAPEGDQLLGNSSGVVTPPADLQGRIIHVNTHHLPGLLINHLTHMDSGIYRRECWKNQTIISQNTQQLSVCDEEVVSQEIIVNEEHGGTELLCNSTAIGLEGTSVRWYHEKYPSYKLTLFLDSSVSLNPVPEEGVVEVRNNGALVVLNNSMLKNNNHFYCLVMKGKNCLSFQNMYLPDRSESREMFVSLADKVVLNCSSDGNNQQWETPFGSINASSVIDNNMYVSFGDQSEDFSLVILAVSDEHIGEYSCISPSLEQQYSLVLCPKKKSLSKMFFEGENALLVCDTGEENDSQRVKWHRLTRSGEYELICDSNDETVPIPKDLKGRLTVSEKGSSLAISHVKMEDNGMYRCVVLGGPEFLDDNYIADDFEEGTEEDEFTGDEYWYDTHKCIFKQEIFLSSTMTKRRPSDSVSDTNVTPYAVGGGLVGLLVVGGIIAVIAIKKRRKASPKQIEETGVPDCTQRLTCNE